VASIGNELFGPQGTHWGAQVNLIGSVTDHLIEARGAHLYDAIDWVSDDDARYIIAELVMRIHAAERDTGGDDDAVVQS
jgi:hypothetical protein